MNLPLQLIQITLFVIPRLVNSNEKIHKLKLEELCKETYEYIQSKFSWTGITPSLNKLLAHSFQIVQSYNNEFGLHNSSKEYLKLCCEHVRKTSFIDNIRDI